MELKKVCSIESLVVVCTFLVVAVLRFVGASNFFYGGFLYGGFSRLQKRSFFPFSRRQLVDGNAVWYGALVCIPFWHSLRIWECDTQLMQYESLFTQINRLKEFIRRNFRNVWCSEHNLHLEVEAAIIMSLFAPFDVCKYNQKRVKEERKLALLIIRKEHGLYYRLRQNTIASSNIGHSHLRIGVDRYNEWQQNLLQRNLFGKPSLSRLYSSTKSSSLQRNANKWCTMFGLHHRLA